MSEIPGWDGPPRIPLTEAQLDQAAAYTTSRLLDQIYPIPKGMEHEGDCLRLLHADIDAMNTAELRDEGSRARLRLMIDPSPHDWLIERVRLVEGRRGDAS